VVGIVLVIAVLAAVIFLNTGDLRIRSSVDDADDTVTVDAEMEDGTATGHFSASEDAAYLTLENIPELSEDETYQVWLFDEPGGSVVSVDTYPAEDRENDEVEFRGVAADVRQWITRALQTESRAPGGTAGVEMSI